MDYELLSAVIGHISHPACIAGVGSDSILVSNESFKSAFPGQVPPFMLSADIVNKQQIEWQEWMVECSAIETVNQKYALLVFNKDKKEGGQESGFFKAIAENAGEGVSVTDSQGGFLYVNNSFEKILGYSAVEIKVKTVFDIVYPADLLKLQKVFENLLSTDGLNVSYTLRYRNAKREWRTLECNSVNLTNHAVIKGILTHFHDVTENYNVQQKIKLQERYLLNLINAIPIPVWAKDWNGKITLANKAYYDTYVLPLDELLYKKDDDNKDGDDIRMTSLEADRKLMITTDPTPFYKAGFIDPENGEKRFVQMRKVPVIVEPDRFDLVHVASDITSHIASEDALKQKNDELQKLNTELDRFIYSASHELRAPLTSALGLLSIVQDECDNPDMAYNLSLLNKTVKNLEVLVRRLGQFSSNKRNELLIGKVNFKKLLKQVIHEIKESGMETVKMKCHVGQTEDFYSDDERIRVLLKNLIENAFKYQDKSKEGSFVQIIVSVRDKLATLEVTDNGIGIGKKSIDRIFDLFYRAATISYGSGLGLYIVKETVSKLNGTIDVQSLEGEGSCFVVTLPDRRQY